jgi:hypothetical protein
LGGLERYGIHHAPSAQHDELRLQPLNLEPLRFLLVAGVWHLDVNVTAPPCA